MATTTAARSSDYPVQFDVDYDDGPRNRLTTFFRLLLVIPIAILLTSLGGWVVERAGAGTNWTGDGNERYTTIVSTVSALLVLPPLLMILFRQKYPRWWFDWNLEFMRFENRVSSYLGLLRDEYPSTDEHQAVHLNIPYPNAKTQLNRFLPLVKWILAIPHIIVLIVLGILAFFSVVIAWFAILFTGRYPRGLFDFVVGVMRWGNRVTAYAVTMMTDRYPPFRLAS